MNAADRTRRIIRTDGTEVPIGGPRTMTELKAMVNAKDSFDTVLLRHLGPPTVVMLVDDLGHDKGLPVNQKATALYHANCIPGTTHQIVGDVAIVLDEDFA